MNLGRRMDVIARPRSDADVWMLDLCHDGDGLCRQTGTETPALDRATFDALLLDRYRTLVTFTDEAEPTRS